MPQTKKSLSDHFLNIGFIGIHLACALVIWVGFSWTALAVCAFLYFLRMFAVTAGYHRYFAHRTFKTTRTFQLILALLGASSLQNGPLWWAAHHRNHHRYSDTEQDVHSPVMGGFWWAHVGWILSKKFSAYDPKVVHDLEKFPEIRWVNRFYIWVAIAMAAVLYVSGVLLESYAPSLNTSGPQLLVWGFFISTTVLYHGTFTINSLAHQFGSRRFNTTDDSRNNFFLALITLGEGWHNNHHRYLSSERQGFYWWEIDISHYILTMLSWVGIVWDLKTPPKKIYDEAIATKQLRKQGKGYEATPSTAAPSPLADAVANGSHVPMPSGSAAGMPPRPVRIPGRAASAPAHGHAHDAIGKDGGRPFDRSPSVAVGDTER